VSLRGVKARRLDYVVDGEALIRSNLACAAEASVNAYVTALQDALVHEFGRDLPDLACSVATGPRELVRVEGGDENTRANLELRARGVADAIKRCVPWPVYE